MTENVPQKLVAGSVVNGVIAVGLIAFNYDIHDPKFYLGLTAAMISVIFFVNAMIARQTAALDEAFEYGFRSGHRKAARGRLTVVRNPKDERTDASEIA